jgi:hypothetical protein
MSVERLNRLKNYLSKKGWVIETQDGKGLYDVVDEQIHWQLHNNDPKLGEIDLEFFLFDDF